MIEEEEEEKDTFIPLFNRKQFHKKIEKWINHTTRKGRYAVHTCTNKKGSMLYPADPSKFVEIIHTLTSLNQENEEEFEDDFMFVEDETDF